MSQQDPDLRPARSGLAHTWIGLILCFAIGIGGGTLYKLWPRLWGSKPVASSEMAQTAPAPGAAPAPPASVVASNTAPPAAAGKPATQATSSSPAFPVLPPAPPASADKTGSAGVTPPGATITAPPSIAAISPAAGPAPAATTASNQPPAKSPAASAPAPSTATAHPDAAPKQIAAKPPSDKAALKPAAPARHKAAKATAAPSEGPFRIQFGAYAIEENAQKTKGEVEAAGMKVEIVHAAAASGKLLYFVRSAEPYSDRAAAASAAATVKARAQQTQKAEAIDYVILGDHPGATKETASAP